MSERDKSDKATFVSTSATLTPYDLWLLEREAERLGLDNNKSRAHLIRQAIRIAYGTQDEELKK